MSECDLSKDKTWRGQYYCGIHCVWFRDDSEIEQCPVGIEESRANNLDSTLTKARKALSDALIPEVVPYPLPEVGAPPESEYDRALKAGGRVLSVDRRIKDLAYQRDKALEMSLKGTRYLNNAEAISHITGSSKADELCDALGLDPLEASTLRRKE